MTKILGCPGTERSRETFTRPARSVSAPSHFPACEARTPAPHTIVRVSIFSDPNVTPAASQSVTMAPSRTSTPSDSRERRAVSDRLS